MKIDELISAAQNELDNASGDDKQVAQAKLATLKSVKASGIEMDNDEVNGLVTRKVSSATSGVSDDWKELFGMEYNEAKTVFENMDDETLAALSDAFDSSGEASQDEGGEESPRLKQVIGAVSRLQSEREDLSKTLGDLNQRYARDKVDVAFERALDGANFDKKYLASARRLAGLDDLVEKVTKGGAVSGDEVNQKVEDVRSLSDVWFKQVSGEEEGGIKLKPGASHEGEISIRPHIPATPSGRQNAEITDDERRAQSSSPFR